MPRFLAVVFTLLSAIPAMSAAGAPGGLRPVSLRCEYRVNPLGIDAAAPRLSWKLEATNAAARGLSQSAYQVLVASSEAILMRNQGDLWDTGRMNADTSIQIPYAGKPLSTGQAVWWKVRVWDNNANPSAWSEPARWSMGLLAASDWEGKWIGLDGGEGNPKELVGAQWISVANSASGTIYLRRSFEIPKDNPVSSALLIDGGFGRHHPVG